MKASLMGVAIFLVFLMNATQVTAANVSPKCKSLETQMSGLKEAKKTIVTNLSYLTTGPVNRLDSVQSTIWALFQLEIIHQHENQVFMQMMKYTCDIPESPYSFEEERKKQEKTNKLIEEYCKKAKGVMGMSCIKTRGLK